MIGSNNIRNNKVIHRKPTIKSTKLCQPHNMKNNLCCKHLKSTNSFTSFTTKKTRKIYHESNCRSKNLIYLLEYTSCEKQNVEKSDRPFYFSLNKYQHRIKSMDQNNLILVKQNFWMKCHNFNRDAKFTIIERIKKKHEINN